VGLTRKKRLVALCALTPVALGFLGLLSLHLVLWLGASSTAEAARGQEATARERIRQTLTALVSSGNRESRERQWQAARWLSGRCADLGYGVRIQEYERKGERWPNVVASRVPLSTQAEQVVAMAHFDSVSGDPQDGAPGADDNGSGVAVLLEVARTLREFETDRPVAFCFFSNEEVDNPGSEAFAGWARRQNLRIRAAVNVDVVGYNRPARLVDWSAVAAQVSWKGRGRAVWVQVRNGITALRKGPDALLVAGRRRDRWLVDRVGGALERGGGLSVVRKARDDCG
jgi:hypothetical protein